MQRCKKSASPLSGRRSVPIHTGWTCVALALLFVATCPRNPQAFAQPAESAPTSSAAQSQGDIDSSQIRKVGGGVSMPVIVFTVSPRFSDQARAAKFAGTVLVTAIIDTAGIPRDVHVVRGVGMGLDEAASDAIKQYRFKPAMLNDRPVAVRMNIQVNFQIADKKNSAGQAPTVANPNAPASPDIAGTSPVHTDNSAHAHATSASTEPYADEPIVIVQANHVYSMAPDGTGWREHTFVARLQSDSAVKQYGVLTVPYASASEHVELEYARARHPDGTVTETQVSEAIDMPSPVTRQAPFYSDQKELELPIRSLRVGDTLELKYRVIRTRPEVPDQFWGQESFSNAAVALSQIVELRVPAGMPVNVWSPTHKPVESSSVATAIAPSQHIYRWSFSQLNPTAGKEAEAAAAAKKKILWTAAQEIDAEQGKLPTIAWTTFKSWEQVGAWYRSLEADRIVPDDTVKAKAAELAAGQTTEEGKAHAFYNYVATNIRYIGVAFGIGRYQPHSAAEILANQYGDCKDKHTLLAALLAAEGIHADAALIGAGIRFNPDVPSPAAFNHLITRLTLDGKPVWLDTTVEVAPWGMLVSVTRDKQALVIPFASSQPSVIVRTPLEPVVPDTVNMQSAGSLDVNGVSTSHLVLTLGGDSGIPARAVFRQLQPAQYDQTVGILSKAIGFSGTATNPQITRPTDTTKPFQLSFDYKREKAGDWDNLKTIPEVMPALLPRVTDIDPPVRAIQLGLPRTEDSTSSMKLPDGWSAFLPAAVHAKCAYAIYDMTYRLEGGILYAERHLVILAKKVPVSDWKTYQTWVDKVNPGREAYIQLLTASNKPDTISSGAIAASPAAASTQGQVRSLMETQPPAVAEQRATQIQDALDSSDPALKNNVALMLANHKDHLSDAQTLATQAVDMEETATSNLVSMDDKVKSFDQMGVLGAFWQTLGWVYFQQGQQEKAEAYMRAAWELKPRNPEINLSMGLIDEAQHKIPDAIVFYRMSLRASSLTGQASITARLGRLGAASTDSLPPDVVVPLPSLALQPKPHGNEPVVDILLSRGIPPVVNLLEGDPALVQPLTEAIRSALANPFPDLGPEKLLRRAHLTCSSDDKPVCALHFLGSQVAMQQSSGANQNESLR